MPTTARTRALLLTVLGHSVAGLDDPERRHDLMREAIELARSTGDTRLLGEVLDWYPTDRIPP